MALNQGAVRIVDVGSPHPELHSIALDIFVFCRTNQLYLLYLFLNGFPENLMLVQMKLARS